MTLKRHLIICALILWSSTAFLLSVVGDCNDEDSCWDCLDEGGCVWCDDARRCQKSTFTCSRRITSRSSCPNRWDPTGAVVGAVLGSLFFICCIVGILAFFRRRRRHFQPPPPIYMAGAVPPNQPYAPPVVVGQPIYASPPRQQYGSGNQYPAVAPGGPGNQAQQYPPPMQYAGYYDPAYAQPQPQQPQQYYSPQPQQQPQLQPGAGYNQQQPWQGQPHHFNSPHQTYGQ